MYQDAALRGITYPRSYLMPINYDVSDIMKARYGAQIVQDPDELTRMYLHGGIGASVHAKVETYLAEYGVIGEEKAIQSRTKEDDKSAQEVYKSMSRVDHTMIMWHDEKS